VGSKPKRLNRMDGKGSRKENVKKKKGGGGREKNVECARKSYAKKREFRRQKEPSHESKEGKGDWLALLTISTGAETRTCEQRATAKTLH